MSLVAPYRKIPQTHSYVFFKFSYPKKKIKKKCCLIDVPAYLKLLEVGQLQIIRELIFLFFSTLPFR